VRRDRDRDTAAVVRRAFAEAVDREATAFVLAGATRFFATVLLRAEAFFAVALFVVEVALRVVVFFAVPALWAASTRGEATAARKSRIRAIRRKKAIIHPSARGPQT
jgi:hypothetical protein